MMFELGQLLKRARMDRGITIDDLQETTKIRKRYLEAIEEGNFKVLPGNFYVKAFIKSYAEAVGLDPIEVLNSYKTEVPTPPVEPAAEPSRRSRPQSKTSSIKWNTWITGVMLWSFLILILAVMYYFISKNYHTDESKNAVTNEQTKHVTDKTPSPGNKTGSPSETDAGKGATASSSNPTVTPTPAPTPVPDVKLIKTQDGIDYYALSSGGGKLSIQLNIVGEACWFKIDKLATGGKKSVLEQGTLQKGQNRSWELDTAAFLTLGAANQAQITVNGTSISVGDAANVKKFQFDLNVPTPSGSASPNGAASSSSVVIH